MGITLSLPLPQSAATRPSIWACSRSTLVLPLGFLKLNPVIHFLLIVGAEAPVCLASRLPVPVDASLFVSGAIIGVMDDAIDY